MKVLVIGFGSIGNSHINNLLKYPNVELIICSSKNSINLETKKKELKNTITKNANKTNEEKGRGLEYYKYNAYLPLIKDTEKKDATEFYSKKYEPLMNKYYELKNSKVKIPKIICRNNDRPKIFVTLKKAYNLFL